MESFIEVAKAQSWAVEPQGKNVFQKKMWPIMK
jgi:hypothetical protein